ncbi:hypothetical protein Syun_004500 [Stephania yunnanensis]|uniref:Uncharacterized protein n=1 Tax=Stephania yunnanensis TaxID=152371 RepID=A0AAP0Q1A3_9MAGN
MEQQWATTDATVALMLTEEKRKQQLLRNHQRQRRANDVVRRCDSGEDAGELADELQQWQQLGAVARHQTDRSPTRCNNRGYSRVSGTYLEASAGHFKGVGVFMFTLFPCVFVYGRRDDDLERCVGRGLPFNRFLSFEALGGSLTSDQHVSSFDREEGVLISSPSGPSLFYDQSRKGGDWRLPLIWNASTSLLVGGKFVFTVKLSVQKRRGMLGDVSGDVAVPSLSRSSGPLGILVFDQVQIRSRARARRQHLAIYSEDIGAAFILTLL